MDGSDEGTTYTDSSSKNHTITANGNANTETSIKKFGTASHEGDGTGDYLSIPDSADWDIGIGGGYGSALFTLEGWIRSSDITKSSNDVCGFGASGRPHQWLLRGHYDNGGTQYLDWQWWNGTSFSNISDTLTNLSFSQDTWYHVAVSYDGTTTSFYFNGSRVGTSTDAYASRSSNIMRVGGADNGSSWHGYIDDFRITKGVSRYSGATITIPTAAFPDS